MARKILVVGFGNTLLQDEGVGVWVVKHLQWQGDFPPFVEFKDGGTSSLDLLAILPEVTRLIIVDAMRGGGPPGSLYRKTTADLKLAALDAMSLHQLNLGETLALARQLGYNPLTTIIGIEPANIDYSLELSLTLQEKLPQILKSIDQLVREIICTN